MSLSKQSFSAKVSNGLISWDDKNAKDLFIESLEGKDVVITIEREADKRTSSQNNALWLYFTRLAEALNDAGLDMRKVIKEDVDIEWDKDTVRKYLWIPIQEILTKKSLTRELDKLQEIDKIYSTLNRFIGEKFGIHIEWPSIDNQ